MRGLTQSLQCTPYAMTGLGLLALLGALFVLFTETKAQIVVQGVAIVTDGQQLFNAFKDKDVSRILIQGDITLSAALWTPKAIVLDRAVTLAAHNAQLVDFTVHADGVERGASACVACKALDSPQRLSSQTVPLFRRQLCALLLVAPSP